MTIVLFLLALALTDRVFGAGMDALYSETFSGDGAGKPNEILRQRDHDIIVFGSSCVSPFFGADD
ncbi:MAG: hypothetical protein R3A47_03575 [Polyangiales bacterium]